MINELKLNVMLPREVANRTPVAAGVGKGRGREVHGAGRPGSLREAGQVGEGWKARFPKRLKPEKMKDCRNITGYFAKEKHKGKRSTTERAGTESTRTAKWVVPPS